MDPSLRTLIEQAEFKESFRGYDRAQVDDTLEQLASQAGKLESQLAEASTKLQDAETRIRAEAEAEVEARVQAKLGAGAAAPPVRNEEQDAEEVRLTLVMAQRTADAAIAEARTKAAALLDEARTEALRTTADARSESTRERHEGRKRLADEVQELESVRVTLQGDIQAMEQYVSSERQQLGQAIERLQQVLDDPTTLRSAEAPAPTPVTIPEQPVEPVEPVESVESAESAEPVDQAAGNPAAGGPAVPAPSGAADAPSANSDNSSNGQQVAATGGSGNDAALVDHVDPGITSGDAAAGQPAAVGADPGAASPSVDAAHEEDAFLSELRKAMNDDEPAGPGGQLAAGQGQATPFDGSGQGASPADRAAKARRRRR